MDLLRTFSTLYTRRRRIVTIVLTVLTSVTTITVVHKCVMVDTIRVRTTMPVEQVAQAVHGTVIASAELRLPRRDTVIVHDTIRTTCVVLANAEHNDTPRLRSGTGCPPVPGVTRTAAFRDSTFAGIISGTVTAPPDSEPLGIRYRVTRPVFAPTIAFLQTKGRPVVVVSWQGEQVTLDHVVFRPYGSPWVRYVEVTYAPMTREVTMNGVVGVRIGRIGEADVKVAQQVTADIKPAVLIAIRRDF